VGLTSIDNAIAGRLTYGRACAYEAAFAPLRRRDSAHWAELDGYRPFFAVTRHAEVSAIQRRSRAMRKSFRPRTEWLASCPQGGLPCP
jgi:hypothetical protein